MGTTTYHLDIYIIQYTYVDRHMYMTHLVVQGLTHPALASGVQGGGRNAVHGRLADVLDGDWDVVVPDQHLHAKIVTQRC